MFCLGSWTYFGSEDCAKHTEVCRKGTGVEKNFGTLPGIWEVGGYT